MCKIYCFRHGKYDGTTAPDLSCKMCCSIYVSKIKSQINSPKQKEFVEWKPKIEPERLERIRASLSKINEIMSETRRQHELRMDQIKQQIPKGADDRNP